MAAIAIALQTLGSAHILLAAAPLLSAVGMRTEVNFESLAKKYAGTGLLAAASAKLAGNSGVKHAFALAVTNQDGTVKVVADAALSVSEVDEVKVLAFFAKVYDVKPKAAVLCVSPKLNPGAAELARQYGLCVIESEKPRELIPMLAKTIDKAVAAE